MNAAVLVASVTPPLLRRRGGGACRVCGGCSNVCGFLVLLEVDVGAQVAELTRHLLLALAHRSWQLDGHDDVQDDVEDAAIRRRALRDEASDSYDLTTGGPDDDDSAPEEKA